MREWRQAPVDLPSSLFFCCYWPLHLLSLQAAKARWDRLASAAQSPAPPSQHHLGIHTPNGVSRCSCHSGACVILDLLLQFWCPVSQPWHWTCIKTSHSTAGSTRISSRGKPDAGRDDWAFITGVHTSRSDCRQSQMCWSIWGVQHPISTQPLFTAGQLPVHTSQLSLLACALPGSFTTNRDKSTCNIPGGITLPLCWRKFHLIGHLHLHLSCCNSKIIPQHDIVGILPNFTPALLKPELLQDRP